MDLTNTLRTTLDTDNAKKFTPYVSFIVHTQILDVHVDGEPCAC